MLPVARVGDIHVCGNPTHPPNAIAKGGLSTADGMPIARVTDLCACGAVITKGSSMATEGGLPVAYMGSTTQCGPFVGVITTGSPTAKVMP